MEVIAQAIKNGRKILTEFESKEIIKEIGIPVPLNSVVKMEEEIPEINIPFPWVMKGIVPGVTHKTEMGLVVKEIKNLNEARIAFKKLKGMKDVREVLVEKMIEGKREFLCGINYDSVFGHVLVFGIGGILTEALDDIAMRLCPVDERECMRMIREIRAKKLLEDFRGEKAVNLNRLCEILAKLSVLPQKYPRIKEVDLNPLIPFEDEIYAVDALIILH